MQTRVELNPVLLCDSYKVSHPSQYSPSLKYNFAYLGPRGGHFSHTLSFGLQAFLSKLNEYFSSENFNEETLEYARNKLIAHLGQNEAMVNKYIDGWRYVLEHHHGKLPIRIQALPEGSLSPASHPVLTVENTDPNCAWLVGWMETIIQRQWYPNAVATHSASIKNVLAHYLLKTTGSLEGLEFKLHDFGARASTSQESAAIASAAHLIHFMGTDTLASFDFLEKHYDQVEAPGFSVPATEHSTTTSFQRNKKINADGFQVRTIDLSSSPSENLQAAYEHFFKVHADQLKSQPFGIISMVIDTEGNPVETAEYLCQQFKDHWCLEYPNIRLVLRPDSGEPIASVLSIFKVIEKVGGCHLNSKEFKEFNLNMGVLQGDGICESTITDICEALMATGYSIKDILFGEGGKLHQSELDRDTQEFAYKSSYVVLENEETKHLEGWAVGKETSGKKSMPGRLMVFRNDRGDFITAAIPEPKAGWTHALMSAEIPLESYIGAIDLKTNEVIAPGYLPALRTVYENGEITVRQTYAEIRELANQESIAYRARNTSENPKANGSMRVKPDLRQLKADYKSTTTILETEVAQLRELVVTLNHQLISLQRHESMHGFFTPVSASRVSSARSSLHEQDEKKGASADLQFPNL